MKIQLDTQNKIIKVQGMVKFCDLLKQLEGLLPEGSPFGSYKEYSIDCNTEIQWNPYPVIVNPQQHWWESLPVYTPMGICGTGVPNLYVHQQPATNISDSAGVGILTDVHFSSAPVSGAAIYNFTLN